MAISSRTEMSMGPCFMSILSKAALLPTHEFLLMGAPWFHYDSIDHHTLMMRLSEYVNDRKILRYIRQFLRKTVEWGGLYQDVNTKLRSTDTMLLNL